MANDRETLQVLFAGLPKTGKTSYLALLYTAISRGLAANIVLGSFRDDREYLNGISKQLMECKEAKHTEIEQTGELSLSVDLGPNKKTGLLVIPDLSGETWEHALYERIWPESLDERARTASGALIFVHVHEFDAGPSIVSTKVAVSALSDERGSEEAEGSTSTNGEEAEAPARSYQPTQVQVVDLLQLLCEERGTRPVRAGIVLSAWDLTDRSLTPAEWIETNAPLVSQYLNANDHWLEAAIWGVSAQGGSFKLEKERRALLEQDVIERALIVSSGGEAQVAEDPVVWVLGDAVK